MNAYRHTVVGLFRDHDQAQRAFNDLRQAGFSNEQLGVMTRDTKASDVAHSAGEDVHGSHAGEGAAAGLAAGAGVGALWGLGIVAGILPAIGPAIAGGALAAILSSAAAGAAAAGLAGALIGLGIPEDEAEHYEQEVQAGRTLVTVHATERYLEAVAVLERHGAYNVHSHESARAMPGSEVSSSETVSSEPLTGTSMHGGTARQAIDVPVEREEIQNESLRESGTSVPRAKRKPREF